MPRTIETNGEFRRLDDLVLHLKGLVLVRKLRERSGADADELSMLSEEIDRTSDELADFVRAGALPQALA